MPTPIMTATSPCCGAQETRLPNALRIPERSVGARLIYRRWEMFCQKLRYCVDRDTEMRRQLTKLIIT